MGFSLKKYYLVMIIVLGTVGVSAAYAVTITLSGDVNVENGDLGIGTNVGTNDDTIKFDDGTETLQWDETDSRFEFSDNLALENNLDISGASAIDNDVILFDDGTRTLLWDELPTQFQFNDAVVTSGVMQSGNSGPDVAYNRIGTGSANSGVITASNDLFVTGDLEVDNDIFADDDIFVGTDDGTDTDSLCMDGPGCSEVLEWSDFFGKFILTDDLVITGTIQTESFSNPVTYNRIGTGLQSSGFITESNDLFVTGDLEVESISADGDIWIGTDDGTDHDGICMDDLACSEGLGWFDSSHLFQFSDDLNVVGKLTAFGGVDPPYVSYSAETHDSIKQLAIGVSDHEEVMQFWNKDNNRFEVYVISQDTFYTFDGEPVPYVSTGIPEKSAVNRLAEFEEQEKIRMETINAQVDNQ